MKSHRAGRAVRWPLACRARHWVFRHRDITHMKPPFHLPGRLRPRLAVLAAVALLVVTACEQTDPLALTESSETIEVAAADELVPANPPTANLSHSGRLFGPTQLWNSWSSVEWGPEPFTGSLNQSRPKGIISQIDAARRMRQRLVLVLTGGPASDFMSNGDFDMAKWKKAINAYNTSSIKRAVAEAVSDGTVIGNQLVDEPETSKWRDSFTKRKLDEMAVYARQLFPTLPMGVVHGPPGYKWRSGERYNKLDFVRYQYNWNVTDGNVGEWRQAVLAQARRDGVTPAFSLNILDGGVQDRKGTWDCGGTGGKGTYYPNCRMTPDQVRTWGRALVGEGCFLAMWRYDDAFMSKSANKDAFKSVASAASSLSKRSCRRA